MRETSDQRSLMKQALTWLGVVAWLALTAWDGVMMATAAGWLR